MVDFEKLLPKIKEWVAGWVSANFVRKSQVQLGNYQLIVPYSGTPVMTTGNQTVTGVKTFSNGIVTGSGTIADVAGINIHHASLPLNLESTTAATYSAASPNGNILLNSKFTGQVGSWNNARIKWGFDAAYTSSGARFGIDVLNSSGGWSEALLIRGDSVSIFTWIIAQQATTGAVEFKSTGSGGRDWYWATSSTGNTPVGTVAGDLYIYDVTGSALHSYYRTGGSAWFANNVSALSFTDRTPGYEGDALSELKKVKTVKGEIDHTTLPAFARKQVDGEDGRDLGAMISMLTVAVQQLSDRLDKLEK
jgi:hypothetical protein